MTSKSMKKIIIYIVVLVTLIQCKSPNNDARIVELATNKVVLSSEIDWEPLNPARGDNSPKAATIWGNRKGKVPTGFLAKFKDGFSSPPHIHNVSYRALVISGQIHNDDANADEMWMPVGSFWTQPAGAPHITSAKGAENIAYVEIDNGPYLVKPITEAFDSGERPVNIDVSNIVWLGADRTSVIEKTKDVKNDAKVTFLWEKNGIRGNLIKLPKGFKGVITSTGSIFHAIIIQNKLAYQEPNSKDAKELDPGSYFYSEGKSKHQLSVDPKRECLLYIRTNNDYKVVSE